MTTLTHQQVYDWIDAWAPFDSQEDYDNAGFLVGSRRDETKGILLTLDVSEEVVKEAVLMGANLIISHHPLMFQPVQSLVDESAEARVIRLLWQEGISLIAAHTNLDLSPFAAALTLAETLGLSDVKQEGFLALGHFAKPVPVPALRQLIREKISPEARVYGDQNKQVTTLAIAGGAADSELMQAKALGADALLTGEARHHNIIQCLAEDMVLIDAGHFQTEVVMMANLACALQSKLSGLKWPVKTAVSAWIPYGSDR